MTISLVTSRTRKSLSLTAICMLLLPTAAFAEAEATVNGADIDSSVVDLYLESALQKPAAQATPEERSAIIIELTDIYLLATQPTAQQLAASERFKAQIELQNRGALAQAVAQDFIAKNQASDEAILAAYDEQIAAAPPLQFKARHILVENQAAAIELIEQLDTGSDFQELAKEHSTGPSGPSGGDLPWFSPEQMVQPFSEAVAALEDGQYSPDPVQTQFGWHVILREDSRTNEPPTLESVRATIKQNLEQAKFQSYLEKLRSDYQGND